MHDPSRVRVTGPLEPFAVGLADALRTSGYTARGISGQLYLVAHLSRWLAEEHLGVANLTGPVVERFVVARRAAGYAQFRSPRALGPLLFYLRELGQAPPPSLPHAIGARAWVVATSRSSRCWSGWVCAPRRSRACASVISTGTAGRSRSPARVPVLSGCLCPST